MLLDGIRISAPDLDEATRAYALLLGMPPTSERDGVRRFQLGRGAIELTAGAGGIDSLGFFVAEGSPVPQPGDVALRIARGTPPPHDDAMAIAIDHVVVHAVDAARAIATWRDDAGLRLALDREFPARGLRLLFFRSNGITLEFATPLPAPTNDATPDRLWGVSYRVRDLTARRERLLAAGVDVSEVRTGMKPGTTVATVRAGTAGIPTILIQPDTHH
ncbi:MAG TPA: VOC family protein [Candidatus Binatia bacterium]|jgi:catechol 2,3-dioxygenase-like lactoylglutathione lyase family enzyme|nr:VOC family protein [Candidatus Binatia bacterium]